MLHLPFFIFEVLSVIVILYYLIGSFRFFHWVLKGYLGSLLGFFIESGIIAFPLAVPFALSFVARCRKHKVVISSIVDVAKTFNIIFSSLALIIISELLNIIECPALLSMILYSVGVFCIPWFFVVIGIWEHKNNERISVSIFENPIRLIVHSRKLRMGSPRRSLN